MAYNCKLLSIFFSEISPVRFHYIKKLIYNCAYSSEMNRTTYSTKFFCKNRHINKWGKVFMIHFAWFWIENHITAMSLGKFCIMFKVSRIAFQILIRWKLHRVYKIWNNSTVIVFVWGINKTCMTFMKIAHSGNKSYCKTFCSPLINLFTYFCNSFYNFHCNSSLSFAIISSSILKVCSSDGNAPFCVSSM